MKINLVDIKGIINKYSVLLSNLLRIDVEIVDDKLIRIAGTGIYEKRVGENIKDQGYVYKKALDTGKTLVIENPGEDRLCAECKKRGNCNELMEICVPIKYEETTFGIIGLVCSDEGQKENLKNNLTIMIKFLEQIAEFISIKVIEQNEILENENNIKFFREIINAIDDGIITVDRKNEIINVNNNALKLLKVKPSILGSKISIEETDEYTPKGYMYDFNIENEKFRIIGKVVKNYINNKDCNKIIIFKELVSIEEELKTNSITCDSTIGQAENIVELKKKIKKVSYTDATILITGESGTGKELVARAIHSEGNRKNMPFIAINCGAIPENLLESELFGYVKGAFSGASSAGRIGKFELANNGVIFLDEIGDMPLYLQVKILRVLQEKTIVKIGSNKLINLNIRVIAATNKNLKKLVDEGKFRADLYYRLNIIPIEVPSLKDRGDDVILITKMLIEKYNARCNKYIHTIDKELIKIFKDYSWPGNIRELENIVEFMVSLSGENGIIGKSMLPTSFIQSYNDELANRSDEICMDDDIIKLKEIEKMYIKKALAKYGHSTKSKIKVAKKLGIGIATLYRKMEE
ncbi:sigma 54-interacting transcriptional regulator [Clostridium uliginosum]|uniref:Transcriptional regulator containing PAS, AAA-type ATPase, and DNA-binding Fis domains n=1 Tax=Clostridium uliginosum TaxID=119641 RepID=A0A1I1R7Q4_9CLOT|nr:sigma 54-interacting transcriptional regulator [Clostridium uliginosum]SFD30454.1 Transcriptional regulator containing PAS, AAA-type ATPase, and DNA-binding Fis domains [Clostridium uliginosum]